MANENSKKWYVVQAQSGYENHVMKGIQSAAKESNLLDKIGDVVVPSEEVVEMRNGQQRKSVRKFYPGYVFVNMVLDESTWYVIKDVPRVIGFLGGTGRSATPIADDKVNDILQRMQTGSKPRPKHLFEPGEVVRVKEGPFVDFNGVVEEVNYEKNRLRVAVLIFGRSTPVELEFSQVEKV